MSRVVLAMSGGVDSSVAAHLLRAAGHEVIGLFMRHGEHQETSCATDTVAPSGLLPILPARSTHKQGCCSASDAADARRVADRLDIPFYALNFEEEFDRIIDYFVDEYTACRTPNPCVMCNNWLKFGRLRDYADGVGAEFIATGHYARLEPSAPGWTSAPGPQPAQCRLPSLRRGLDGTKDQSYVLFGIDRDVLPRVLFPVGNHCKQAIREMAKQIGLRVADKPDSQEICFVPQGGYADFVRRRRGGDDDRSGDIVTTEGTVVGRHDGIEGFTVGQRKGLGVAFGEPRYVVRLERDTRRVVIGRQEELARQSFTARQANWLIEPPFQAFECRVQLRYRSPAVAATVEPLAGDRLRVDLREPRFGVAPGQAVVCYDDDTVLGGGWIE
jgi:tRNA-uridine 2-sulfurtransferase